MRLIKVDGVAKSEALKKETTISGIILMAEANQSVAENQLSYFLRPCQIMIVSQKLKNRCQHDAGLDPASCIFNKLWIPAFAGMTGTGLFAVLSILIKLIRNASKR